MNETMETKPLVLIIDDHNRSLRSLALRMATQPIEPVWVSDVSRGIELLKHNCDKVFLVIIDLNTSEKGCAGFLYQCRLIAPRTSVLITTPLGPILYRSGNFYNLHELDLKNHIEKIVSAVHNQSDNRRAAEDSSISTDVPEPTLERFGPIIGCSNSINAIYRLIERLRASSATVLINGESGTGKELIARTIHQTSTRSKYPFIAINCGAIPANLMESELFGHERGSFTSAVNQHKGKFEIANHGTIFLDEIAELDKALQVKFLRVLQEREFQRVGGSITIKTDVRIIAASSQNLKDAVESGIFRDDLFYRLNVMPIYIQPLRERREDIPLLVKYFSQKLAEQNNRAMPVFTPEALEALQCYSFPGNIRELINILERIFIICSGEKISYFDLPDDVRKESGKKITSSPILNSLPHGGVRLKDVEKELIIKTLNLTNGNKLAAAKKLGITRRLLYLRLDEYGMISKADTVTQGNIYLSD